MLFFLTSPSVSEKKIFMRNALLRNALYCLIIALTFILATPIIVVAASSPSTPLLIYGDVTIGGGPAPAGTEITVENNGVEIAAVTVGSAGKYFVEVPAENAEKILTYKVDGIVAAEKECADPSSVPSDKIDLSITTALDDGSQQDNNHSNSPSSSGGSSSSGSAGNPPSPEEPADEEVESEPEMEVELKPETQVETEEQEEVVEVLGVEMDYRTIQLNKISDEAEIVNSGDVNLILDNTEKDRDHESESAGYHKYTASLIAGFELADDDINAITNFIIYGTETTLALGAGERAGTVNSYKAAFGKLPTTQSEWEDVIKIANGRWPSERSEAAEEKAKQEFEKVYLRAADMGNPNDNAAVTIMAYGLRPDNRNLDSERAAINIFKAIYGYNPFSATDWDTARAIAYSGAMR